MQVALKVWRFNSRSGERELQEFEIDAPEEATLLDCLDIVKDKHDGTLAYRKSCRMMICGSCGMRMDGAAVLACKTRMYEIASAGHIPVISAMGNLPIVKDLVVDMDPFWEKFNSVKPYLQPGYEEPPDGKEYPSAGAHERDPQGGALHQLRLLRLRVQRDGVRPALRRPAGAREGRCASSATRATAQKLARLEKLNDEHGIWECTRCYFCNERCPKGVDPRDAIAKLGAESMKEGIDRDMGAKHAKWFVTLGEDDRLAARDGARAEDAGRRLGDQADEVRDGLAREGQGAAAVPAARREERRARRARLHDLVRDQGVDGYAGDRPGRARARQARARRTGATLDDLRRPGAFHRPYLQDESERLRAAGALNQAPTPASSRRDVRRSRPGDDEVERP